MLFVALLNSLETIFLRAILLSKRMKLNLFPSPFFIWIFEFQGSKKVTLLKKVVKGNQHYRNGQKIVFDICLRG